MLSYNDKSNFPVRSRFEFFYLPFSLIALNFIMELNKMITPNSHKTSFDIRLPHDPKSKCNKFITKGYSTCLCLLNISIKVGISIAILMILLSQLNPQEVINGILRSVPNKNSTSEQIDS